MTFARKLRVVVYLTLLFAGGVALGFGGSQARRPAWTQSPEWAQRWLERRMKADFEAIQATPEQQAELRPLYDQLLADFRAIQDEASAKLNAAFGRFGVEMSQRVTPEQFEKLKRHNQRLKSARTQSPNPDTTPPNPDTTP